MLNRRSQMNTSRRILLIAVFAMTTSLMGCAGFLDPRGEEPGLPRIGDIDWPPDWDRRQRQQLAAALRRLAADLECREPSAGATLTWTSPITTTNLPNVTGPEWARIENRTICLAVNSYVIVRADNHACSHCHYTNSGSTWSPPVAQDFQGGISRAMFAGQCLNSGPAKEFRDKMSGPAAKPPGLRAMMAKWIADGCQ
jgi:hypothetical protein